MKIGIVDADLLGRQKHRFPNLACEKISGYWKAQGAEVTLLMDYDHFDEYDHVYVSKVFTDTPIPEWLTDTDKIHIGGTGFYFDKAPNLPDEIEHHMPDYVALARWANQPSIYKKMSFRYFCEANQALKPEGASLCATMRAMVEFEQDHPEIAKKYFDLRYDDFKP